MSKNLILSWAAKTHQGKVRKNNQDAYGKFPKNHNDPDIPPGQLFIISDGLGGHNAGQVASQLAVRSLGQEFHLQARNKQPLDLREAVKKANRHIFHSASSNTELSGMGTTCSVLLLFEQTATIAHVGDSRIFLINRNEIIQLTQDHSQVAELQRQGILTKEEAQNHPERNILTRALGTLADVPVDVVENIDLQPGDAFLLCTDGLTKVTSEELQETVLHNEPQKACDRLVRMANDRGGEDNVTVVVVQLASEGTSVFSRLTSWFTRKSDANRDG